MKSTFEVKSWVNYGQLQKLTFSKCRLKIKSTQKKSQLFF